MLQSKEAELNVAKSIYNEDYRNLQTAYKTKEKDDLLNQQELKAKNRGYLIILVITLLLAALITVFIVFKKNKTLKKLTNENGFLLEEVNHRIKNNLQLIVSLLERENSKVGQYGQINNLTAISLKIESIATLHQLLYVNDEKQFIALDTYLFEIIENAKPLLENQDITILTDLHKLQLDSNTALYLGLILNELIFNSIKHAFKNIETKKIEFSLHLNKHKLLFNYNDNGIGLSEVSPKLVILLAKQIKAHFVLNKKPFNFKLNLDL